MKKSFCIRGTHTSKAIYIAFAISGSKIVLSQIVKWYDDFIFISYFRLTRESVEVKFINNFLIKLGYPINKKDELLVQARQSLSKTTAVVLTSWTLANQDL